MPGWGASGLTAARHALGRGAAASPLAPGLCWTLLHRQLAAARRFGQEVAGCSQAGCKAYGRHAGSSACLTADGEAASDAWRLQLGLCWIHGQAGNCSRRVAPSWAGCSALCTGASRPRLASRQVTGQHARQRRRDAHKEAALTWMKDSRPFSPPAQPPVVVDLSGSADKPATLVLPQGKPMICCSWACAPADCCPVPAQGTTQPMVVPDIRDRRAGHPRQSD